MFIKNKKGESQPKTLQEIASVRCQFDLEYYSDRLFDDYGIVFPLELAKAVPKRKAEFLAGRYCAKLAIEKLGGAHSNIAIGKNRSPIWPQGVIGSISHDKDNAIAMVKPKILPINSIGVDIEKWVSESELLNLQDMIINKRELQLLDHSNLSMQQAITVIFSAKESFFKAVYPQVGEYFGFAEARLTNIQITSTGGHLMLSVSNHLKTKLTQYSEYEVLFFLESKGLVTVCNI